VEAEDFVEVLNGVAQELAAEAGEPAVVERILKLAIANLGPCVSASMTLVTGKRRVRTPYGSDERACRGDALQYELGEGPCLAAVDDQQETTVYSGDVAVDARWPTWGTTVERELGVRSVLSVQLYANSRDYGTLNLYSLRRHAFGHEARVEAEALAAHAAPALAAQREIDGLQAAVTSRHLIGQAQGILMERFNLDADHAFAFLARLSSSVEQPVREVAKEIVATRSIPRAPRQARAQTGRPRGPEC
jgi:transcriptional regulator with GAF, ATPase, and Fis domain